jgi:signal transduction histidine kinase/ActR/RegA family two-component response regulator
MHRDADADLVRQSSAARLGNAVLAIVVLVATPMRTTHPTAAAAFAGWMLAVIALRSLVARAFASRYEKGPRRWRWMFRVSTLLSSATWGLGGAWALRTFGFNDDYQLLPITLAGVAGAGIASLSGDLPLLRAHLLCTLIPILATVPFARGTAGGLVGFEAVVATYLVFLWNQGTSGHAILRRFLRNARLLEQQALDLDVARRASLDASAAKSAFLANMSHEIRTPMTAVLGYADLLLDPTLTERDRCEHIGTIRRNGKHLLQLINDVLDLSKIEAGQMTVEQTTCSPQQVVAEVASLMRLRATARGLAFQVVFAGPIPGSIRSDAMRLRQILINLVGNAIKFTARGSVLVRVRCDGERGPSPVLVFEVVDTGIGLSKEQIDRLFKPFAQADSSTTRRFGGSGLGLMICKRLAALLGGDVAVLSRPGRGSIFTLTVPTGDLSEVAMLDSTSEAGLPHRTSTAPEGSLVAGVRVLLAEDGLDNQRLLTRHLHRGGALVTVVGDGKMAVHAAQAEPFDVILMDMQMPELDGYEATSLLRREGYGRSIIALTAHAMAGDRERCLQAGCDDYVSKPISRDALLDVVARWGGRETIAVPGSR